MVGVTPEEEIYTTKPAIDCLKSSQTSTQCCHIPSFYSYAGPCVGVEAGVTGMGYGSPIHLHIAKYPLYIAMKDTKRLILKHL